MRFGLAFTLMRDGYFAHELGDSWHGQDWWYDELEWKLGSPTSNATFVGVPAGGGNGSAVVNVSSAELEMWVNKATAVATKSIDKTDKHSAAGSTKVVVQKVGSNPDCVDVRFDGLTMKKGVTYKLSFWAKAVEEAALLQQGAAGATIELNTRQNRAPWTSYGLQYSTKLTGTWSQYSATFSLPQSVGASHVSDIWMSFFLGKAAGVTVWLDSITVSVAPPPVVLRHFQCGLAVLNGAQTAQTISIPDGYARLIGSQAPRYQYTVDDGSDDFTSGVGWTANRCPGEENKAPPLNSTCFVHGYNFDKPSNEENMGPYYHTWEQTIHYGTTDTAVFDLKIPVAGKYTISAWWPAVSPPPAWATNVEYAVRTSSNGNVLAKTSFNQAEAPHNGDRWNVVSNLTLPVGAVVTVRCVNAATCVADALLVESAARLNDGSDVSSLTLPSMDGAVLAKTSCRDTNPDQAAATVAPKASTFARSCGPVPLSCAPNCGGAIVKALTDCNAGGGGTVTLSAGIYEMNDTGAKDHQPIMTVAGLSGVALKGETGSGDYYTAGPDPTATTLMVHGMKGFASIADSANVRFEGLQVDMLRQPYTYGQCTKVSGDSFEIKFDPEAYPFDAPVPDYLLKVQSVMGFDPIHWRMARNPVDIYVTASPYTVTLNGGKSGKPNSLTVHGTGFGAARIVAGGWYVLRHQVYSLNAFSIQNSSQVTLEDVQLYSIPGMGFYSGLVHDIFLKHCGVRWRPGRPMSITADASHFNECSGTVHLDGVHFEGQGDDGLNIHGMFHDVRKTLSPGTFELGSRPAGGISKMNIGGRYEFRNRDNWTIEAVGTCTATSIVGGKQHATFDWDMATSVHAAGGASGAPVSQFALLTDVSLEPEVLIENSYFGNNRARGTLIKSSNVVVKNNTYNSTSMHCILAFPDGCYWFESNGFKNWYDDIVSSLL